MAPRKELEEPREREEPGARLSEAQLGIWLGHQRAVDPSIYDAAECVLLTGPFDVGAFERALDDTLREATALHVAFPERRGVPEIARVPYAGARLEIFDLSAEPDPERALLERAEAEIHRPFAIERGELFRHFLARLGPARHGWLHVAHHIALDGYGFNLIARRVAERYAAERRGAPLSEGVFTPLEPVVLEDHAYQSSEARERDRQFWLEELGGLSGVDFSTPGVETLPAHGRRARFVIDEARALRWKKSCEERGVGWSEVFLALVAARLHALTGRAAFVLGLPVMLRLGTKALKTPCMAMNIAPLPVRFQPRDSIVDTARALRAALARERRSQKYRYEHLRADRPRVKKQFGPVVNVLPFDFPLEFGELRAEILPVSAGPVEDLSFSIAPRGGCFEVLLDGHPSCFSEEELVAILEQLSGALDVWLAEPDMTLMGKDEQELAPLDPARAVFAASRRRPEAAALVEGEDVWTYAELDRAALRLAARLKLEGVAPGELVALDAGRSARAVVALLGVLYAGAGYVALDPGHPVARRRAIVRQVKPRLVLSDGATAELGDGKTLVFDEALWSELRRPGDDANDGAPFEVADEASAYVVFTSGSTGEPKGVVVTRGALAHFVSAARVTYGIQADDRVLQFAPLTFDASVEELFVTWAAGATLVLRDDAQLESMRAFWSACRAWGISVLDLPTAFWHELVLGLDDPTLEIPASLRLVIIGGEAALPERVRAWRRRARGARLLNTYGPSEATVVATCADLTEWDGERVPIGVPLPGVRALLFDEAGREIEGEGQSGEIFLAGPTLAAGYLGREDLTRARFSRGADGARLYRTGDRALRANGALVFSGRADDEVKISGYRIAPAEIEAVLARHPRVRAVVVRGEKSEAGARLVAHVEAAPERLTERELRDFVAASLPAPFVPSVIVVQASLPRTAHGKLDRTRLAAGDARSERALGESSLGDAGEGTAALQSEAAERSSGRGAEEALGSPRGVASARAPDEDSPLSEQGEAVLRVWREVLGVERIALDDDFFARGGTSLQVIQVANRLSRLGREITVASIFRHPTLRQQIELIERNTSSEDEAAREEQLAIESSFVPLPIELSPDFRPRERASSRGRRLLLTGASGFVGVHVLERWLESTAEPVVGLVRGESEEAAWSRLLQAAGRFGIDLRPHRERIEIVPVDLASPDFRAEALEGRVAPCSVVLHAAAQVSVTRDYESLFGPNVVATREMLELAARWGADFHHVSTIATLPDLGVGHAVLEEFFPLHAGLTDGYQRSKWHAEALCVEAGARGLPIAVHRLARVSGSTRRPRVNASDLAWRVARAASRLGAWPDLAVEEHWTPVDLVADLLVRSALRDETSGARFDHLVPVEPLRWERLRDRLVDWGNVSEPSGDGRERSGGARGLPVGELLPLELLPLEEWIRRLRERADDEDRATLAFFELKESSGGPRGPRARDISWRRLAERWPDLQTAPVSDELLRAYCRSAAEAGLLRR